MPPPESETLLVDAAAGHHVAQLHRTHQDLAEAVSRFVEAGLRREEGVVVIASTETQRHVWTLARKGLDLEACRQSGQLAVLDAEATTGNVMRGGMPDWEDFRRTVGGIIEAVQASGRIPTRVYSEMASTLWLRGETHAGVRVEDHWNTLAGLYSFSLFCGYVLDVLNEASYAGPLREIGRTHSHVVATEHDRQLQAALEAASRDVLGVSLSSMLTAGEREDVTGEQRLPLSQRTMLWLRRNMPGAGSKILERARRYYKESSR